MANRPGSRRRRTSASTLQGQIWQAMRALQCFDLPTLAAVTESEYDTVARYLYRLRKAGYVRQAGGYISGRVGSRKRFVLTADTGPKPPVIGRDGRIYDQNLEKFQEIVKEAVNE